MCNVDNFQRIEKIGEGKYNVNGDGFHLIWAQFKKMYSMEMLISGTYGVVFKAVDTSSGKMVALKRIRLEKYVFAELKKLQ